MSRRCIRPILLTVVFAALGCSRPSVSNKEGETESSPPLPASSQLDFPGAKAAIQGEMGNRSFHLTSASALRKEGSDTVHLASPVLSLLDPAGHEVTRITADSGTLAPATESVAAYGSVVVHQPESGRTLETEELHYQPRVDRIWSPVHTVFRKSGLTIQADRFESNIHLDNIRAWGGRGSINAVPGWW